jgi:hypothetical protein
MNAVIAILLKNCANQGMMCFMSPKPILYPLKEKRPQPVPIAASKLNGAEGRICKIDNDINNLLKSMLV